MKTIKKIYISIKYLYFWIYGYKKLTKGQRPSKAYRIKKVHRWIDYIYEAGEFKKNNDGK